MKSNLYHHQKVNYLHHRGLSLPSLKWSRMQLFHRICDLFLLSSSQFSSVQSLSHVWLFVIPWTAAGQASLSITNPQSLLKLMSIESVMPSNHLIFCCPLLLLPSIFPSISLFQWVSGQSIGHPQVVKVLELQLQHQSLQWIFRVAFLWDWLVWSPCSPGTLKSLLQHHSSKALILWHSAFFIVQLSHPSIHGKTIAFTMLTFVPCLLVKSLLPWLYDPNFPGIHSIFLTTPQSPLLNLPPACPMNVADP